MPWSHCDAELGDDVSACPDCGVTKEQWTLEFEVTRTFQVARRRSQISVELIDREDAPVAGERVRVHAGEAAPIETSFNGNGLLRLEPPEGDGALEIEFFDRSEGDVEEADDDDDEDDDDDAGAGAAGGGGSGGASGGGEAGDEGEQASGPRFRLSRRRHRLRLLAESQLRLRFVDDGEPRAGLRFSVSFDEGDPVEGELDDAGQLEVPIPSGAGEAEVTLGEAGPEQEQVRVRLDRVEDAGTVTGAQQRLNRRGFGCGAHDGDLGEKTAAALQWFQRRHHLEPTGELDAATIDALRAEQADEGGAA